MVEFVDGKTEKFTILALSIVMHVQYYIQMCIRTVLPSDYPCLQITIAWRVYYQIDRDILRKCLINQFNCTWQFIPTCIFINLTIDIIIHKFYKLQQFDRRLNAVNPNMVSSCGYKIKKKNKRRERCIWNVHCALM